MEQLNQKAGRAAECGPTYEQWRRWVLDLVDRITVYPSNAGDATPLTWDLADTGGKKSVFPLAGLRIAALPPQLTVNGRLDLRQCQRLRRMGSGLQVHGDLLIGGRLPGKARWLDRWEKDALAPDYLRMRGREIRVPLRALPTQAEVTGDLILRRCDYLRELPEAFKVGGGIMIVDCPALETLPDNLILDGDLILISCPNLRQLPKNLNVRNLTVMGCGVYNLPSGLRVGGELRLENCPDLVDISALQESGMKHLKYLLIRSCPNLWLPNRLAATNWIRLENQPVGRLTTWLESKQLWLIDLPQLDRIDEIPPRVERLVVRDCPMLRHLPGAEQVLPRIEFIRCSALETIPATLRAKDILDLTGCTAFHQFPETYRFGGCLIVLNTALNELPEGMTSSRILGRENFGSRPLFD